jgi:hypothetical protein
MIMPGKTVGISSALGDKSRNCSRSIHLAKRTRGITAWMQRPSTVPILPNCHESQARSLPANSGEPPHRSVCRSWCPACSGTADARRRYARRADRTRCAFLPELPRFHGSPRSDGSARSGADLLAHCSAEHIRGKRSILFALRARILAFWIRGNNINLARRCDASQCAAGRGLRMAALTVSAILLVC